MTLSSCVRSPGVRMGKRKGKKKKEKEEKEQSSLAEQHM